MGGPVGAHTRTQEPEPRPPPGKGNKFEQRRPAPFPLPRPRPGPDSDGVDGQGAAGTPPPSAPRRKVQPARARGRRRRGGGKVRVGGGLIPLPPARRPSGGGEPWPLKEEQVGGVEWGGGKRRRVEREEQCEEGGRGEPPRSPHLPHPPQHPAPGAARGGYLGLPGATLKPRVLRSETKSSFFERSGCALELCDSARAGEQRAGGDGRGRGGAARTPSPGLPTHALLLEAIPYPSLSRCRARAAVKVTGRTSQHRTEDSGPRG